MKIIYLLLLTALLLNGTELSQLEKYEQNKKDYKSSSKSEYKTIIKKENGVIRKTRVPIDNSLATTESTATKKGVVIAFKNDSKVDISALESKYNIKFKKRLIIGYYIFENLSTKDDASLVEEIILNEPDAKTVVPNWPMEEKPN